MKFRKWYKTFYYEIIIQQLQKKAKINMGPLISEVSMKVTEYEKYLLRSNFEKGQ